MNFYVKATGSNRYSGGSLRWLKIRSIKKNETNGVYEIGVRIRGEDKYTDVSKGNRPEQLKFKFGRWPNAQPIAFDTVILKWEGKDLLWRR
jgi:hypothetical protein